MGAPRQRTREEFARDFWARVKKRPGNGCWIWTGGFFSTGYGIVAYMYRSQGAHRAAWELTHGAPADGHVCHRCDNRACVRPDHLFVGTASDNMADAAAKGRLARGQRQHSAKLTPDDVVAIRAAYASGATFWELARRYDVAYNCVWSIVHRVTWKHVI